MSFDSKVTFKQLASKLTPFVKSRLMAFEGNDSLTNLIGNVLNVKY